MSYHAVTALRDAYEATRAFLWPVDAGRWWRLAVVVLFLGGSGGVGSVNVQGSLPNGAGTEVPLDRLLPSPRAAAVVVAVVVALVVLGLLFAFVAAVMEFVMYGALRTESVALRADVRRHLGRGARLFAFRIGLGLTTLVLAGVLVGVVAAPAAYGTPLVSLLLGLVVVPLLVVFVLAVAAVGVATTSFVVPTMLAEETGVLDAWRRVWPVLRAAPGETAVYGAVWLGLALARGLVVGAVSTVGGALLAVPFLLAAGAVLFVVGGSPLALVPLAALGLVYLALLLALFAVVNVPVVTYLRYVALFVLGDLDPDLDVIAERRAAVRADGGEAAADDDDGDDGGDDDGGDGGDDDGTATGENAGDEDTDGGDETPAGGSDDA
jgi:hypothetical protein